MKKKKIDKAIDRLNRASLRFGDYKDVFVFLINANKILKISEGTGDNLLKEDIKNGYVDYIYYESYDMDDGFNEDDGGDILLKEYFKDKYYCTAACVDDVMKFIEYRGKYIILSQSYYKDNEWYKEVWTDEDIAQALSDNGIIVNNNNISQISNRAKHIFDDKSDRCEKLSNLVREVFAVEDLRYKN